MIFHQDPPAVADAGDEYGIQLRFRQRLKMLAPDIRVVATPNGGQRTAWQAIRAKGEGLVSGWPDVTCYWSNGIDAAAVPGMALLEFKAKAGSVKPEQVEALNWLTRHGFACGVFRSAETAIEFLRKQGAPFLVQRKAA